jgi:hypothetical protein
VARVRITREAAAELDAVPPLMRPALLRAAIGLQSDPEAGTSFIDDPGLPLRRLDVTDGTSIVYYLEPENSDVLITQIAQPHMLTPAICLDEAERVQAEFESSDPIREVLAELAAVARDVLSQAIA